MCVSVHSYSITTMSVAVNMPCSKQGSSADGPTAARPSCDLPDARQETSGAFAKLVLTWAHASSVDMFLFCLQLQPLHLLLLLKDEINNTNLLTMDLLLVASMCSTKSMDRWILRLHGGPLRAKVFWLSKMNERPWMF